MRTFNDEQGQRWQAALLEASYGNVLLTFNPFAGHEVRQIQMDVDNMVQAGHALRELDEAGLQQLLRQARPWDQSMGVFTARD